MLNNDLEKNNKIDIVVSVPSYNEADNIAFVVKQIDGGLRKYFPRKKAVIVNVDNNSQDGTKKAFLKAKTITPKIYLSTRAGIKGKGYNFYNLFNFIKERNSKINIVVDADLKSIEPKWIKKLAMPIKRGYDFVAPFYTRNKRDALITNHFCYPLVYGLLGWDIAQPIGGDFAFSLEMVKHWLSKKWPANVYQFGIDIFMTTEAIMNDFRVCQAGLGRKVHKPSQMKLQSMFIEVAMTLFNQLITYKRFWTNKKVRKAKIFYKEENNNKPQSINFDLQRFKDVCQLGFKADEEIIHKALSPENYEGLKRHYESNRNGINSRLWSKIVYDFLYIYEKSFNKRELIKTIEIIAFCRFFCYARIAERMNTKEARKQIIEQAKIFRVNRDYLLSKYKN